jgi:hypothetical protein
VTSPWCGEINNNRSVKANYLFKERGITYIQEAIRKKKVQIELGFAFTAYRAAALAISNDPVFGPALGTPHNESLVIHRSLLIS